MRFPSLPQWCRHLLDVVVAFVVVLSVVFVAALWVLPRTGQAHTLSVLTGSMSPSISAGSLVFIRPVEPRSVTVGDVVTFRSPSNRSVLVTHRVVGFVFGMDPELAFRTKGDANRGHDLELVPADDVVGRVVYSVPKIGSLSARGQTRAGFVGFVVLPLALLAFGGRLAALYRKLRRPRTAVEAGDAVVPPSTTSMIDRGANHA